MRRYVRCAILTVCAFTRMLSQDQPNGSSIKPPPHFFVNRHTAQISASSIVYAPGTFSWSSYDAMNGDTTLSVVWKPFDQKTIVNQMLWGIASVAVTGGIFVSFALVASQNASREDFTGLGILVLGAITTTFTLPASVYFSGNHEGGNGTYLGTFAGCVFAGGLMLVPNIVAGTGDIGSAIIRTSVATFLGSIAGYHLSASPVYQSEHISLPHTHYQRKIELAMRQTWKHIPTEHVRVTVISIPL